MQKVEKEQIVENLSLISLEINERVALLTLRNSKSRNSLSLDMLEQLIACIDSLDENKSVLSVVITGEAPAFCAGHDLKEITSRRNDQDNGRRYFELLMRACVDLMQRLHQSSKIYIAAVEGIATAAGCQLVAGCDLAVCASNARFATPGVDIGLFCSTPMVAISRCMHPKQALHMLVTGELLDAQQALSAGLVNKLCDPGEAVNEAMKLARKIATKSPLALELGKPAFYKQLPMDTAAAYEYTESLMVENLMESQAVEGIRAFLEKRNPDWQSCE